MSDRLAYTVAEAAEVIGMSPDSFRRHVLQDLRVVRRGRFTLIAASEIQRWLAENSARTLATGT
jgi:hypothetical protein